MATTAFDEAMAKLNKSYGMDIITLGFDSEQAYKSLKKIPFSSPRANYMTYGGIPRGRLIEFAGEENGGKTTTALDVVANAQIIFQEEYDEQLEKLYALDKPNKGQQAEMKRLEQLGPQKIVYADAENTLDEEWATLLGVDCSKVHFYKPQQQSAEEIFEDILNLILTGEVGLVVLDSIGTLTSSREYEKSVEDVTVGGISKPLTNFSKKAASYCKSTNCTLIGINQLRDNVASRFGGTNTPGGRAWKHNCSVRIMFSKGYPVDSLGDTTKKSDPNPFGNQVEMDIVKTKCFKPDRRAGFYTLSYSDGIEPVLDLIDLAVKYNIIVKAGSYFTFTDPTTGEVLLDEAGEDLKVQGKNKLLKIMDENLEVRTAIETKIADIIAGRE